MALVRLTREEARGKLPFICVRCGARAIAFCDKKNWYPPWANVFVLVFFVPLLILTKRVRLRLPFCRDHYDHWFLRALVVWGSLLAAFVLSVIVMVVFTDRGFRSERVTALSVSVSYGTMIGWAIFAAALQYSSVRPCTLTKEFIVIRGVAPIFVDAVKAVQTPAAVGPAPAEVTDDHAFHIQEGYPPRPRISREGQ